MNDKTLREAAQNLIDWYDDAPPQNDEADRYYDEWKSKLTPICAVLADSADAQEKPNG